MTNTNGKVLRFSELTPNRIAKLNEFAVHVPNVDVSFVFRRITNGMWVFQTDSAVPVYLPGGGEVNPPHLMSDDMTDKIPTFEELKISPSMLKSVAECPLKFWQSYITKTLPYVESAQKARGTKLHKFMEDSIDSGVFQYDPDDKSCASARKFFSFVNSKKQKGWKVKTEVCCGVDMDNVPVEYAKANLRCRKEIQCRYPPASGQCHVHLPQAPS